MQPVRKKVQKFIAEHKLLTPGNTVVVAVSGGADSIALLGILANLPGLQLKLVVAHVNHSLRGAESDGDELFVRRVATEYNVPFELLKADIKGYAEANGLSLEEAGREVRRSFFREVAVKYSADAVALGHHRDDQAETILMRLIRGAAASGLTGMRPKSVEGTFIRPILCLSRGEIVEYLEKGLLRFREDSSNTDVRFMRNRVRHELLPLLRRYNPEIAERLNQTADALAADEELLDSQVDAAFKISVSIISGQVRLNLALLTLEPMALRKRIYRKAISRLKGNLKQVSSRHLADIDALIQGCRGSGSVTLPGCITAVREYNVVIFRKSEDEPQSLCETVIDQCGIYTLLPGVEVSVEPYDGTSQDFSATGRNTIFVDSSKLPFPWTVRPLREGDRFVPFGMQGRKKLKDLFIDRKIPVAERTAVPLFTCDGVIFWVGGVQAAENSRICGVAAKVLCLNIFSYSHNVLS
ncbi:MAG: tRNA lysidine(34) synthetase TilS [Geobacteraceae bacterium]|nr:tRNA lysidine(34) synthetase TilS [Geobacteraceae bacterium]